MNRLNQNDFLALFGAAVNVFMMAELR